MFRPVNPKQSFSEIEKKILEFWQKEKIFEKSVERRKGKKKYVFFDGPPFANGLPHYGHILANVLKDAIPRYFTMKGCYVPRVNGWDCHGLPVEYEIEKELGISGRKQIEKYGVGNFNQKCRESVFRYTEEWEKTLTRIGRWVDFKNSYATLNATYMESIWWVFKEIWDKKMVYQDHKSMHICPRCVTPLSNFEVSLGYKDVTEPTVVVKFKFKSSKFKNSAILAWTTTPWTLGGNVLLALGKGIKYVEVESEKEKFILAKERLKAIFKDRPYRIKRVIKAQELVGLKYQPLYDFYLGSKEYEMSKAYEIITADFVSTEEGTGVVHIAPAFGEDDLQAGKKHGAPVIQHVKMDGTFKEEVKPWAGKFVKSQDEAIISDLKNRGLLFDRENYRHSYPHCWRCETPLLNYATQSWFIKVTAIKNRLLENNQKIHWQPEHIKDGRFGKWLEGARDWAISRSRFWGCPIPIWECPRCLKQKCIGSVEELKKNSIGGKLPLRKGEVDLHLPYLDEIKFSCSCGAEMSRIPEVFDCWFESGAMPYAELHYPFENKKEFENNFPGDFIAEGLDQTRGWFYTLHVLASILFNRPAFQNVIVNGILLAKDGEKLSKRKKNYPDPNDLFESKGVDALRFFLLSSTAPLADEVRFSENHVDEILKKFILPLLNTYSFFVTYANIDQWKPRRNQKPTHKLDQWILSELNTLTKEVAKQMDAYNLTKAARPIIDFGDNLSNWYVRRSRRRFWKSENDQDKDEAYQTLYTVLTTLAQILAPFTPFLAEEIYQNLSGEESVHLTNWPKSNRDLINLKLNQEIKFVRQIVALGHAVRAKANLKVRQPLSKIKIGLPKKINPEVVLAQKEVILEELNIKELEIIKEVQEIVLKTVKPDPKLLGPKYGPAVQEIIKLAKEGKFTVQKDGRVKVEKFLLEKEEIEMGFKGKEGFDVESEEGLVVALDTKITPELKKEGWVREIVRHLQEMRKEAGYQVDDRINTFIETEGELEKTVTQFADYIKNETLSLELQQKGEFSWDLEKIVEIEGKKVKLAVRRP